MESKSTAASKLTRLAPAVSARSASDTPGNYVDHLLADLDKGTPRKTASPKTHASTRKNKEHVRDFIDDEADEEKDDEDNDCDEDEDDDSFIAPDDSAFEDEDEDDEEADNSAGEEDKDVVYEEDEDVEVKPRANGSKHRNDDFLDEDDASDMGSPVTLSAMGKKALSAKKQSVKSAANKMQSVKIEEDRPPLAPGVPVILNSTVQTLMSSEINPWSCMLCFVGRPPSVALDLESFRDNVDAVIPRNAVGMAVYPQFHFNISRLRSDLMDKTRDNLFPLLFADEFPLTTKQLLQINYLSEEGNRSLQTSDFMLFSPVLFVAVKSPNRDGFSYLQIPRPRERCIEGQYKDPVNRKRIRAIALKDVLQLYNTHSIFTVDEVEMYNNRYSSLKSIFQNVYADLQSSFASSRFELGSLLSNKTRSVRPTQRIRFRTLVYAVAISRLNPGKEVAACAKPSNYALVMSKLFNIHEDSEKPETSVIVTASPRKSVEDTHGASSVTKADVNKGTELTSIDKPESAKKKQPSTEGSAGADKSKSKSKSKTADLRESDDIRKRKRPESDESECPAKQARVETTATMDTDVVSSSTVEASGQTGGQRIAADDFSFDNSALAAFKGKFDIISSASAEITSGGVTDMLCNCGIEFAVYSDAISFSCTVANYMSCAGFLDKRFEMKTNPTSGISNLNVIFKTSQGAYFDALSKFTSLSRRF